MIRNGRVTTRIRHLCCAQIGATTVQSVFTDSICVSRSPYNGDMVRRRAKTVVEWAERMHSAAPPTEDDVTVLLDGRRLDSRESVEAWLAEVDAIRVREAATDDIAL